MHKQTSTCVYFSYGAAVAHLMNDEGAAALVLIKSWTMLVSGGSSVCGGGPLTQNKSPVPERPQRRQSWPLLSDRLAWNPLSLRLVERFQSLR